MSLPLLNTTLKLDSTSFFKELLPNASCLNINFNCLIGYVLNTNNNNLYSLY